MSMNTRTISLEATVEGTVRFLKIKGIFRRRVVVECVDGSIETYKAGDKMVQTLTGSFKR